MIKNEENTKKKGLFDYPEPSEDFNQTIVEASIDPHSATVKAERPTATEYFRIYDRSGCGDISKVRKGIIISLPVKHVSTDFACFGDQDFYFKVKHDIGKATPVRFAYCETGGGRMCIWPVKEAVKDKNGNVNSWTQTANQILKVGLTKWIRVIGNMQLGYYEGYTADEEKVKTYIHSGRPKFNLDYEAAIQKAFDGFILTPDTYETDPHVKDFMGKKVDTDVIKNGNKINN